MEWWSGGVMGCWSAEVTTSQSVLKKLSGARVPPAFGASRPCIFAGVVRVSYSVFGIPCSVVRDRAASLHYGLGAKRAPLWKGTDFVTMRRAHRLVFHSNLIPVIFIALSAAKAMKITGIKLLWKTKR